MATAQQVNAWDEKGNPIDPTAAAGASAWDEHGNPIPVTVEKPRTSPGTVDHMRGMPTTAPRVSHVLDEFNKETGQHETPEEHNKYLAPVVGTGMAVGTLGVPLAEGIATYGLRGGLAKVGPPILKGLIGAYAGGHLGRYIGDRLGFPGTGETIGNLAGGLYGGMGGKIPHGPGSLIRSALESLEGEEAAPAASRLRSVAPETAAPAAEGRLQPVGGQSEDALEAARRGAPGVNPIQRSVDRHFEKARSPRGYFNPGRPGETVKLDDVVNQATGVKPLKPDVPLRDQLSKVTVGEPTEIDPIKAKYPEPQVRQMVRANGERIYEAAKGSPETVKAIHDLTRVELRQALINSGEDMGQTTVSNSKFAGEGSIPREEAFNKLLDKKLTPEKIVELAKKPAAEELAGSQTTEDKYFNKETGEWAPERQAIHQKVIDAATEGKTPPTGRPPEATITVGGTGAGKTTLTRHVLGQNPNIVNVDADVNKLHIPEFDGLKRTDPENAAFRVHEESSHIAKRTVAASVRKGLDFVYDTSTGGGGDALFERLKQAGYKVRVLFADVPTDQAIERAALRARESTDPANFGRHVPESIIREKHQVAAKAFDSYRRSPFIDEMHGYDTTSRAPRRFYERVGPNETIHDQGKIDEVQRKAAGRESTPANREKPALVH